MRKNEEYETKLILVKNRLGIISEQATQNMQKQK